MNKVVAFAVLSVGLAWTMPAHAEACNKPFLLVSSIAMSPADRSGRMTVPVSLNGTERHFLVDSGGSVPQVSPATAVALNLKNFESGVELYGVNGAMSKYYTRINDFGFGGQHAHNLEMMISPFALGSLDGILPIAIFNGLDVDMDFSAQKLNFFSNDHCDGKVIYWPAQAAAAVPITIRNYQIVVPVTIDGHELTAVIDTGSSDSIMRLDVANIVFGLAPDSPDMKAVGHMGDNDQDKIYAYPFKTLSFGGVTVTNPQIAIIPDIVNKKADDGLQTGSLVRRQNEDVVLSPVILGMDALRYLHLYFAFHEGKLYFTSASGTPIAQKSN